jgi:hypothetical protein
MNGMSSHRRGSMLRLVSDVAGAVVVLVVFLSVLCMLSSISMYVALPTAALVALMVGAVWCGPRRRAAASRGHARRVDQ